MAYEVNRTNPSNIPINVEISTTKKQLGLTWVGQYYSRYGEVQSENFLRLLENFANDEEPNTSDDAGHAIKNVLGQLWYHTNDGSNNSGKTLKVYDDNRYNGTKGWKRLEPIVSNNTPTNHTDGELWYQPSTNTFKMSRGSRWEDITVLMANDSKKLDGLTSDQFIRSDIDDTVYGVLRTNEIKPDRHREYDLGKPANRWDVIYGVTLDINNSHEIMPEYTDSYDIGATESRWREGFFTVLDSINYRDISPLADNTFAIGNATKKWRNAHITTVNVEKMSTFEPIDTSRTIGTSTNRWNSAYIGTLDTSFTKSLIPSGNSNVIGNTNNVWKSIHVDTILGTTNTETILPRVDGVYDLGTNSKNYRRAYIKQFPNAVEFKNDIEFEITRNSKSSGITWSGLSDEHSIYVEETSGGETTRLVLENKDNVTDYTLVTGFHGDIARFKSTELEVVAGVLKTKGSLKVEDTASTSGCEMVYNDSNETLDFIFY